ncbi:hypothetical protein BAX94_02325 [Elizabethkingia meningoseptica]|uniref:Peptide O-xylosyltransferase n=1 Tax=Elizabethkingia meningoseptica TaxID=238 RepID=A0A1T3FHR5_ELIME|nr:MULTISPECIES: beta-1,6-N-acetylglucosaminyltransferase [Elizabethkingia]AQX12411.1 hypothetical protein BBD35_08535 [Elizabethkingia meningoseptica]MBG0513947.1 glycosyl transferase [Elizabethkingia meningoseptica]MDE5432863.1 beta-1,6-N-acetylglucosaminyltransferase [Elizabethkingia meningoseptica]MDE5447968.1 beta-1,6-N-acetylglucosaminyltransferase [Elizabethkingia meningoseptica]MDE5471706.1 beta-1,6-N-acetylglucosaminyltransferase [Elizabethkingia meningoseptica]
MKKHVYLIIAHNEFEVLNLLLQALDDPCNDIYIHFDKKVKHIPLLKCTKSELFILENHIDVRWGHISQIEAEYALFEEAYKNKERYSRYHLISGVHFPLKKQNEIHAFFETCENKELLCFLGVDDYEINLKLERYHFCVKNYQHSNSFLRRLSQLSWTFLLKVQYFFKIQKKPMNVDIKANQWVSLTPKAIDLIVQEKQKVLSEFKWSFCADEFFVPYVLQKYSDTCEIVNDKRLLYNEFIGSRPRLLTNDDYDFLIHSDYFFARKFSKTDLVVIEKILKNIKPE